MYKLEVYDCDGYLDPFPDEKYSTILIYALVDPRTNEIRYIGKTNNPERRLRQHFVRKYPNSPVSQWITSLFEKNITPIMRILEIITNGRWEEREIFWIKWGREHGLRLVNISDGGKGGRDRNHSAKTRQLMSEKASGENHSQYGRPTPEDVKKKIADSTRGEKNHFFGKAHSDETKRKISEAKKGTPPVNRRAVLIGDELHESVRAASVACNVSEAAIIRRIRADTPKWAHYRYADE